MLIRPNYRKGIVIAHGMSEYIFSEHIKSNLHLPIEIYAENRGKSSIQIDSLTNILGNNIFKNKRAFKRNYIVEEENGILKDFFIMPIMDLDDTTEERIKKYKLGELFKNHWLSPYIIPIWNDINFDQVLYNLGLISKIPNEKEKGKIYRELFPINNGETDVEQVKRLLNQFEKNNKTNMDVFLKKCLDILNPKK